MTPTGCDQYQQTVEETLQMYGLEINHITVEENYSASLQCRINVRYQTTCWYLTGTLYTQWQWVCHLIPTNNHAFHHADLNAICQHIKHKYQYISQKTV